VTGTEELVTLPVELDELDDPDELHPAAIAVAAATPTAISALFIVRLFSIIQIFDLYSMLTGNAVYTTARQVMHAQ
jgi:hypothetical protein